MTDPRGACDGTNPACRALVRRELAHEPDDFGGGGLWRRAEHWGRWRGASAGYARDEGEAARTGLTLIDWAAQCDWNAAAAGDGRNATSAGGVSCGAHRTPTCAACPQGHGAARCHGECTWVHTTGGGMCAMSPAIRKAQTPRLPTNGTLAFFAGIPT